MKADRSLLDPPPHFRGFASDEPIVCLRRNLPHWRQLGATYFLTCRLADSLPKQATDTLREERDDWLKRNPPPHSIDQIVDYQKRFTLRVEAWLDAGAGSCLLRNSENAAVVEDALRHFAGERLRLFAWVVMPNHFHAVVKPMEGFELDAQWNSWKRHTAIRLRANGADFQPVWFREGYDRIVRDSEHLRSIVRYIGGNPGKAGLDPNRCRMGICEDWQDAGWSLFGEEQAGME